MTQLSTDSGLPHNTDTRKENGVLFVKGNKQVDHIFFFFLSSLLINASDLSTEELNRQMKKSNRLHAKYLWPTT